MKYLIDTHTPIRFLTNDSKIPDGLKANIM